MKNFLDFASARYYAGNPVITDDEFDKLAEEHNYKFVGAPVRDGVPHYFDMFSLKKCYVGEKLIDLGGEVVETVKLDGAAVALLYVKGRFAQALTRGDGKRGQDITDKVRHLVEEEIETTQDIVQITGEIVAPKFIPNARNYAAGALNLKNIEDVKTRNIRFVAYGIKPSLKNMYVEDMGYLQRQGFYDVTQYTFELSQGWLKNEYPQDGKVFRLNSNQAFDEAGYTGSHPRGAYALKERQEGVVTKLVDVVWQVGRTGQVAPVAILQPVLVGDATVARATLHNMKYIEELGLDIGCNVEIIRSGEIIPRVVRRVD